MNNINNVIIKYANKRYGENKSYWRKVFIDELLNNNSRDIWVDSVSTRFNKIGLNIYDQYLVHNDKLFYRRITSNSGRTGLTHNIERSVKKWHELK